MGEGGDFAQPGFLKNTPSQELFVKNVLGVFLAQNTQTNKKCAGF